MPQVRNRFHRRNAPFLAISDKAAIYNILPTDSSVVSWNQQISSAAVLNVSFGRVWGDFANRYEPEVGPNDIALIDTVRNQRFNANTIDEVNPNSHTQFTSTLMYVKSSLWGGIARIQDRFLKVEGRRQLERRRNSDLQLQFVTASPPRRCSRTRRSARSTNGIRGAPSCRTTCTSTGSPSTSACGSTRPSRGCRLSRARRDCGSASAISRRHLSRLPDGVGPRLGVVYDLFGDGRTALKAYFGRFYDQFWRVIPEEVNRNNSTTVQVPWNDLNKDLTYDPGELDLSPFVGFPAGVFPVVLPGAKRPYSQEISAGVEHTLPAGVGLSVSYHRRMFRDGLIQFDRARPASTYTEVARTYTDPYDGQVKPITVYNVDASLVTVRDRVIGNFDGGSNYSGVEITGTKKMTSRWQMLGGVTFSTTKGSTTPFRTPPEISTIRTCV